VYVKFSNISILKSCLTLLFCYLGMKYKSCILLEMSLFNTNVSMKIILFWSSESQFCRYADSHIKGIWWYHLLFYVLSSSIYLPMLLLHFYFLFQFRISNSMDAYYKCCMFANWRRWWCKKKFLKNNGILLCTMDIILRMLKIYFHVYSKPHLLWFLIYGKYLVFGVSNLEVDLYMELML
jgi:hypothetical protein